MNERTYLNATHVLHCRHVQGKNSLDYGMRCHVIKSMPDGRLKIQVFGDRYWKDKEHVSRIRYVNPHRVSEIS